MSIYVEFRRLSIFNMQNYLYKQKTMQYCRISSVFALKTFFVKLFSKLNHVFSKYKKRTDKH